MRTGLSVYVALLLGGVVYGPAWAESAQGSTEVIVVPPAETQRQVWDEQKQKTVIVGDATRAAVAKVRSATQAKVVKLPKDATQAKQWRGKDQRQREIAQQLNLTKEQRKQWKQLNAEDNKWRREIRKDPEMRAKWEAMTPEQRRAFVREREQAHIANAAKVLNEQQLSQWLQLREQERKQRREHAEKQKAQAKREKLGLSQ